MGKLHIRTPNWTEGGRTFTDGLTYCGKDVHADTPSGKANRIDAVPMQTGTEWYRNYDRVQSAIMFGNMCRVGQRHLPQGIVQSAAKERARLNARIASAGV